MKAITIIIVNYRTPDLVIDCLRSLAEEVKSFKACRVIVVDNASRDGSADGIEAAIDMERWGHWAELVALTENRGFAAGNNAALRLLRLETQMPDYVLLLNPDTVVRPGALAALVRFMEANPEAGIAGSRLENPDGTPQRSAFRFPGIASEFERGMRLGILSRLLHRVMVAPPVRLETHQTDWVSGASMIVRRQVFEEIGDLDDDYFLYFEETDFCARAHQAGWSCWYVPESRVVHLVGQSTGIKNEAPRKGRLPMYWLESRARYFTKHHGGLYCFGADLAWSLSHATWKLRAHVQRKPELDPPGLLTDFLRFSFTLGRRSARVRHPELSSVAR